MRVLILLAVTFAGFVVALVGLIPFSDDVTAGAGAISAMTVTQDLLLFIVPAIVAVAICFKRPMNFLRLNVGPSWTDILVVLAVFIAFIPAMNWLVDWNNNLSLPDSMATVERWMRKSEDDAQALTEMLLHTDSLLAMLGITFVVGIMAGFSEEIYFRGAFQQFISSDGKRNAFAVILTAIIFSAFHFQFYGFFPRMLLGMWLGYLLVKSESLWTPIIAHSLNNSTVVVATYLADRGMIADKAIDNIGLPADGQFPWLAIGSAVVTAAIIGSYHLFYKKSRQIESV